MNKIRISLFVCSLILFSLSELSAQFVIAGEVSTNDVYKNIEPDLYFYAVATHHGPPSAYHELDVDFDGIYDFIISSYGGGGLMAGSGACRITALHPDAFVAVLTDTFAFSVLGVDTINMGETINNTNTYSSGSYFWAASYGPVPSSSILLWKNKEHYIGFKLTYPNDTLYGWIRAEDISTEYNATQFYVKDFACNKKASINQYKAPDSNVFPTLFRSILNILVPNFEESEISITDTYGHILFQQKFYYTLQINTENLAHGMYYYKLTNAGQTIKKSKIVKY